MSITSEFVASRVEAHGFAIVPQVLLPNEVRRCLSHLDAAAVRVTRSSGVRNLMRAVPALSEVARHPRVTEAVSEVLGMPGRLVRSILFDKVPGANWAIRWHQDRTIAVTERLRVDGYGPWSVKAGVVSVQPPARILEQMISIRVHLDDCPADNGALRVVPGSHRGGKLSPAEVARFVDGPSEWCSVGAGAAVLMRPLVLHSSSASASPGHRRVIHLDFAGCELDGGLEWSDAA